MNEFFDSRSFEENLIEVCSPHLYASFATFCVQIGSLFVAQSVFKHPEEFPNRRHFPLKAAICRFPNILQRLTVPRMIDQFVRKQCQKKPKDMDYNLLDEFFQKIFCCTWRVGCHKFIQYIRMLYPGQFILIESVVWTCKEGRIKPLLQIVLFNWSSLGDSILTHFPLPVSDGLKFLGID